MYEQIGTMEEVETYECGNCGRIHESEEDVCHAHVDGDWYCVDCADEDLTRCEWCGEYARDSMVVLVADGYVCSECYHTHYRICGGCGEVISVGWARYHEPHDAYYCEWCYDDLPRFGEHVHEYHGHGIDARHLNPPGTRGIGVELELEFDADVEYVADDCYGGEESEYFETDSSIDNGFETVTHIMSVEQHRRWIRDGVGSALLHHAAVTQPYGIGLHVNVSVEPEAEIGMGDEVKSLVYYFVNRYADHFAKLGRRRNSHYAEFNQPEFVTSTCKFSAVNLQKDGCVEFRFFHTATDEQDYIGSVEIAHAIVAFVSGLMRPGYTYAKWTLESSRAWGKFEKFIFNGDYEVAKEYYQTYMACETPRDGETLSGMLS